VRKVELRAVFRALLWERKTSALYVTHDASELVGLADRVAILEGGRIVQQGTLHDVRTAPATPFVSAVFQEPL
jgi:multiple sugar transport system ATP-binding protein